MKTIRQLFCRHEYEHVTTHPSCSQNLFQCRKCGLFCVQHFGLMIHYETNDTKHISTLFQGCVHNAMKYKGGQK